MPGVTSGALKGVNESVTAPSFNVNVWRWMTSCFDEGGILRVRDWRARDGEGLKVCAIPGAVLFVPPELPSAVVTVGRRIKAVGSFPFCSVGSKNKLAGRNLHDFGNRKFCSAANLAGQNGPERSENEAYECGFSCHTDVTLI